MKQIVLSGLLTFLAVVGIAWTAAAATPQAPTTSRQGESAIGGTVVSSTRATLVVRTDSGEFVLFAFDRDTVRPKSVPRGARVSVRSRPGAPGDARVATSVTVDERPPQRQEPSSPQEPVPPAIRRLERQIERQAKRYGVGVRGGVALDPELISVGAHARLGPFFDRDISFRPNVEFAFGEVTTMLALNLEATYRLPLSPRQGRWSIYVGAGPSLAFFDRGFEDEEDGREIDFDELDLDAGLSFLTGVEYRNGLFLELKGTAYTAPHVRLLVGFNF